MGSSLTPLVARSPPQDTRSFLATKTVENKHYTAENSLFLAVYGLFSTASGRQKNSLYFRRLHPREIDAGSGCIEGATAESEAGGGLNTGGGSAATGTCVSGERGGSEKERHKRVSGV
jgi:hypothetical protein